MITVSDNDLKQLLLYVQATERMPDIGNTSDLRLNNRVRLAKLTVRKLLRRQDVQRVMGLLQDFVVADR